MNYEEQEKLLHDNGWEETHGVALWTNPALPFVCIDTNADDIAVYPIRPHIGAFNQSEDDFLTFVDTANELIEYFKTHEYSNYVERVKTNHEYWGEWIAKYWPKAHPDAINPW